MTPEEAAGFYEEGEDPAEVFARFDAGPHVVTAAPDHNPVAQIQQALDYIRKTYGGSKPVSETEPGTVAVIDQAGSYHHFDADDWSGSPDGGVELTRDGKRVAGFPPGYLGVYRISARAAAPVVRVPADQDGGGAQ